MTADILDNSSIEAAEQPSASGEEREGRRRKLVAIGFFLFFLFLWVILHYLTTVLTHPRTAEIKGQPFAIVEISSDEESGGLRCGTDVLVETWDKRLTTTSAEAVLIEADLRQRTRCDIIDSLIA